VLAARRFAHAGPLAALAGALAGGGARAAGAAPPLLPPLDGDFLTALGASFRAAVAAEADADGATVSPAGLRLVLARAPLALPDAAVADLLCSRHLFWALDADGDGRVDWREFAALLPLLATGRCERLVDLPDGTLKALFLMWDPAGEGRLDVDGVVALVRALHAHGGAHGEDESDLSPGALAALFAAAAHAGTMDWADFKRALHGSARAQLASIGASLKNVPAAPRTARSKP
jgi:hypothetical protein